MAGEPPKHELRYMPTYALACSVFAIAWNSPELTGPTATRSTSLFGSMPARRRRFASQFRHQRRWVLAGLTPSSCPSTSRHSFQMACALASKSERASMRISAR